MIDDVMFFFVSGSIVHEVFRLFSILKYGRSYNRRCRDDMAPRLEQKGTVYFQKIIPLSF